MRHTLHGLYKKAAETVLPPLNKSQFDEKRVLTPQEFLTAGEYLVRTCPTWSWEAGDPKKARPYFPPDKQFLVTRNVPCLSRATEVERYDPQSEFALGGDEDGWVATHADPRHDQGESAGEGVPSMEEVAAPAGSGGGGSATAGAGAGAARGDDDIPDMDTLELGDADEATVSALPSTSGAGGGGSILRTRTYDVYITYDQYYQVPRVWLAGYDEARQPLAPLQVLEDVSEEHAKKTITVDPHPHLALSAASIHPCRHAEVMKKLADNLQEAGKELRVDQYLVLFLKFIASVVPTISYDYTMSVGD